MLTRIVQAARVGAEHRHAAIQSVVSAEARDVRRAHEHEISARHERCSLDERVVDALGELHSGQIQRNRGAGVVELDIFVAARRGIEHQLGDAQIRQQVPLVERPAAIELDRQRPVAVPARGVRVQHAHAITAAHAQDVRGNRDVRVEGRDWAAVPNCFDLVPVRLLRIVVRAGRVGHFAHAPAQRLERVRASVRAGAELQLVDGKPDRTDVRVGRARGPDGIGRDRVEREGGVGRPIIDIALQQLQSARKGLREPGRIRRLRRPVVEAPMTRLARRVLGIRGADHLRVVVPHHAVGIEDGRPVCRTTQQVRVFVDERVGLIVVPQEIADFTHTIAKLNIDVRQAAGIREVVEQPALERLVAAGLTSAIHVIRPSEVEVPGASFPQARLGIAVEEIVFTVCDVVVMNALGDDLIVVMAHHIPVRSPPLLGRTGVIRLEIGEVGFIRRPVWSEVVQFARAAFHLVKIAIRQTVLFEEASVLLLDGEIDAPEITFVLRGRAGFLPFIDHAERAEGGVRSFHSSEIEQLETDRLKHPLLPAMIEVPLLDARAEIQLRPRHAVFAAPVVAHLQIVTAIEIELPHVLAHRVTPHAAARTIANVIEHLAVIHQRAAPLIKIPAVAAEPRRRRHGVAFADEMKRRQPAHRIAGEALHHAIRTCATRLHSTGPTRNAVVHEVSKVRLRVVGIRNTDRCPEGIRHCDAITNQPPVDLHRRRKNRGEHSITGSQVAQGTTVVHGQRNPVRGIRVRRIRQIDVGSRLHDLVLQRDAGDAVRVRDFRGDADRLAGSWLFRVVLHLANLRGSVAGKDSVDTTGTRSCAARTTGLTDQSRVEEEIAAPGQRRVVCLHRDGVHASHEGGERIAHHVHIRERSLFKARNRRSAEAQLTGRKVRRVIHHERAVDPHLEAVIILRLENQPVELQRISHRELFPQEDRSVETIHVSQRCSNEQFSVTDRQRPHAPTAVIKRRLPPRRHGTGSLVRSLHVFPGLRSGEQRRVHQRRAARTAAGTSPASRQIIVERRMNQLDGIAISRSRRVTHRRPREAECKADLVLDLSGRIAQRQLLATAGEAGAAVGIERSERARCAILRLEKSRVLRHDHIAARRKIRGRKSVIQAIREGPAREIHHVGAPVVELHEFPRIGLHIRVVMNFVDDDCG